MLQSIQLQSKHEAHYSFFGKATMSYCYLVSCHSLSVTGLMRLILCSGQEFTEIKNLPYYSRFFMYYIFPVNASIHRMTSTASSIGVGLGPLPRKYGTTASIRG